MADSIVGGLFGMTPEMYQQTQNQQALSQASQLAQMSPFELAKTGVGYGANRLAGAIGGALGAEDPQLKLISLRNAVMREVDLNDPNSIMMGAQKLGQFDAQGASALANLAREAIAKNAESTQKFASATKSMAETGEITSKRDLLNSRVQALIDSGTPENLAKGIASNDKAFADFVAAKNISTPPEYAIQARALGYEAKPFLKDYTQEQVQAMEKGVFAHKAGIAKAGASVLNVSQKQEEEFSKRRGFTQANALDEASNLARGGSLALGSIAAMKEQNATGQLFTGPLANSLVATTNLLSSVGLLSKEQAAKLTSSQIYDKSAKDLVMQDLGGKLGAQISDADRKFVEDRIPQLATSEKARTELLNKLEEIQRGKIEYYKKMNAHANEYKNLNNFDFSEKYSGVLNAPSKSPSGAKQISPVDQQALDWANANPKDPRSAQIKQRLGM
jgi:hypothetical protein